MLLMCMCKCVNVIVSVSNYVCRVLAGVAGLAGMAKKRPERLMRLDEVAEANGNVWKDKEN